MYMTINQSNRKKGFTLIELLIYSSAMVLLIGAIAFLIMNLYSLYKDLTVAPRVDRVGITIVDRVLKDIRTGSSINLSQSSLGVATGNLNINSKVSGIDTIKKFSFHQDARITYQEDDGTINFLSPQDLYISRLRFDHLNTDISEGIRVDLEITYNTRDGLKTKNFIGFAILRQSYE
jgi:type II secretory pathway pseudopilin PulG